MGAGVEEDDTVRGSGLQSREHAIEVKTFGLRGPVGIIGSREVDIVKDLLVVGPCWAGEVDLGRREELGEKETTEMDGAGAGDSLE